MFCKGTLILTTSGLVKVQDLKVGDNVMNSNEENTSIVDIYVVELPAVQGAQPYMVENKVLVSGTHLVKLDGKMYLASDKGKQVKLGSETIQYYHIKTSGGIKDIIQSNGIWGETWDGFAHDAGMMQRDNIVLKNPDGSCVRMNIEPIEYKVNE